MRFRLFKSVWLMLVLMVTTVAVQAAVYRCTDTAGRLSIQDHPCEAGTTTQLVAAKGDTSHVSANHPLMWKVSGGKGSAYLVGSIHFGTAEMYPLPAEMTEAFASSQALVVETNMVALDPVQMAQTVAARALYADGMTLSKALSPQTWKQLDQALAQFGASAQLVERQKPWFVSMTLTSLALKKFGFDEERGIDLYFMNQANKKKPIIEMETFDQQLDFLNNFSAADQEQMLKETFEDLEKGQAFLADTLRAWRAGDAQKIDELMNAELRGGGPTGERMYQVLIVQRNAAMVDKLERLLNHGGKFFVVLGAAHFVGKDGIVTLLKDKGYQVEKY